MHPLLREKRGLVISKSFIPTFSTALTWWQNFQRLQFITSLAFYHYSLCCVQQENTWWHICLSAINKQCLSQKKSFQVISTITRFELHARNSGPLKAYVAFSTSVSVCDLSSSFIHWAGIYKCLFYSGTVLDARNVMLTPKEAYRPVSLCVSKINCFGCSELARSN